MSFTARHRFPVGYGDRYTTRPTGLRSRENSSPAHPPVRLSPTIPESAQFEPSKNRSTTVALSNVAPLTPTTSNTQNRKKSWVDSASKSLGLKKLRRKASLIPGPAMTDNSVGISRTQSVRKLNVPLPHNLAGSSRSPIPAPLNHQHQQSPPVPASANNLHHPSPPQKDEKPLPSLPVATVKYQSPVRRSLIDCTEKPLRRRSITPPDGSPEEEEDWPTIEPIISDSNHLATGTQSQVKPSLGESLYEGMRALNLQDNERNKAQVKVKAKVDKTVVAASKPVIEDGSQVGAGELLSDGRSRPISSSQLPKPRDSMLQSLSHHIDSPVVRHTKASTLRLQQATGKTIWDSNEKYKLINGHIPPIRERVESPTHTRVKQDFHVGPVRANSRGRYGVTNRGSPYTIPSRALSSRKPVPRNEAEDRRTPIHTPTNSQVVENIGNGDAKRVSDSPTQKLRKSSLPLPARLAHQSANLDEQEVSQKRSAEHGFGNSTSKRHGTSRLDGHATEIPAGPDGAVDFATPRNTNQSARPGQLLSVKELLSTPAPDEVEFFVDSHEDNSGASIRGYDSFGGYRIRRVGNNVSKMGPTLRITDSANCVLLGRQDERNVLDARSPVSLRHKGSAPDIGSPRIAEDQVRRSSAIFTNLPRPMTVMKNITDRSANQYENFNEDENRNLVDDNGSVDTVVRTELPGSEVALSTDSMTDSRSDLNPAPSTPSQTSSTHSTPKSYHGDWPGKHFADFNMGTNATPTGLKHKPSSAEALTEPNFRRPGHSKSPSRPPTIVLREAPSKETAPFLFQDLEQEQGKQEKLANDLAVAAGSSSETFVSGHNKSNPSLSSTTTPFPPRTSSRKPKPPPIYISPPTVSFVSALAAPKAFAVRPESLKRPRNVKTFSRSVSPRADSNKGRKISGILAHSPSTSNKKKVVSSLRGLFHKKSFESSKAVAAGVANPSAEVEPLPVIPALVHDEDVRSSRGSFRRKQIPTFTIAQNDNQGRKFVNPLHPPSGTGTGMRMLRHKNPLTSPTTPWTANIKTPTYPPSAYPTPNPPVLAVDRFSPTQHAYPSPSLYSPNPLSPATPLSSPSANTSTSTPILSTATHLTHTLLDLARQESLPTKKSHLIELSKCMVEVVSSARDAEKAMEKAKMEASRAEISYLRCLKEVSGVEAVVRRILEESEDMGKGARMRMELEMEGQGRARVREV